MLSKEKALVILSGGQDSTTCLFSAVHRYGKENVSAITFDYGQRHDIEIESAVTVAKMAGIANHEIVRVPDILVSSSPLTSNAELAQYRDAKSMAEEVGDRVEKTFVPMRNTLFLTIAANRAVAAGVGVLITGICQEDNANYPDCTDQFRYALQDAFNESLITGEGARWAAEQALSISAPLMMLSKAESIQYAMELPGCMEALAYSHTSYDGKYPPTDMNHANVLRAKGFEEAGVPDPLVVRAYREGLMPLPETKNYDTVRAE